MKRNPLLHVRCQRIVSWRHNIKVRMHKIWLDQNSVEIEHHVEENTTARSLRTYYF